MSIEKSNYEESLIKNLPKDKNVRGLTIDLISENKMRMILDSKTPKKT